MSAFDKVVEKVPARFIRRQGDWVQEGANNTLLILGTDRPAAPDSGLGHVDSDGGGKGAGTIHAVVGRTDINPNFDTDSSFVYISQKTKVDENMKLAGVGPADADAGPAIAMRSDDVRVAARERIKISIDGGAAYVFIDKDTIEVKLGSSFIRATPNKVIVQAENIDLGDGADQHVVLGEKFMELWDKHQHPTAVGPSGPPMPAYISSANPQVLSDQTKAKK